MNPSNLRNVLDCDQPRGSLSHLEAIEHAAPLIDAILVALANAACPRGDEEPHLSTDPESTIALAMLGRELLWCSANHSRCLFETACGDHRPSRGDGDEGRRDRGASAAESCK
jgi:hypothetical protein